MFNDDASTARSKRHGWPVHSSNPGRDLRTTNRILPTGRNMSIGQRTVAIASTTVIGCSGFLLLSAPAFAAESTMCVAAQASYRTALADAAAADALTWQVSAASQAVRQAQRARDALVEAAVVDTLQTQADLDIATATAAEAESNIEEAKGLMQSALANAIRAADAVDRIQAELDRQYELNAAADRRAQVQLDAATAARSDAAVTVSAAQTTLAAVTGSHDQSAISAARSALVAAQMVLEAAESQLDAANLAFQDVQAHGEAQVAELRYRLDVVEEEWWFMDTHLMEADERFRAANGKATTAADAVTRARAAVLTAQNLEGIAAADAAMDAASKTADALLAQVATSPDPASIDRLFQAAIEACPATSVDVPQSPPPATVAAQQAPVVVPLADSGQTTVDMTAANPGLNLQTGVITAHAPQAPASPRSHDGLTVAAWSLGGLVVVAIASFGAKKRRLQAWMTNGARSD